MASSRVAATASEAHAAEAAQSALARGNAVDAVIAGVFAACGASPGVLLGPVQIVFGGAGLGLRVVDGRNLQPGRGVARPRGFTDADAIPASSRVGVPALPGALAAALATSGSLTLAQATAAGIALATGARKTLLQRVAQRGPSALAEERVAGELVAAAGRLAGGVLTSQDLDRVRPRIIKGELQVLSGSNGRVALVPWRADMVLGSSDGVDGSHTHVVAAADHKGLLAVAAYERHDVGVDVPELGLVAPASASPVLRGQTRVRPGEPLLCAAPIALLEHESILDMALAVACAADAEAKLGRALAGLDAALLAALAPQEGATALLGVTRTKNTATLLRLAAS